MPARETSPYPVPAALSAAVWEVATPGAVAAAYDPAGKHLYVAFRDEDRVARWTPDGAEVDAEWVKWPGVSAVRCGAGLLAVSGRQGLAAFDLATRAVVRTTSSPAGSVSALAVDSAGVIYAADSQEDRVWAWGPDRLDVAVEGPSFLRPSGLLSVANLLFVATAGDATTPGRLAAVNRKTGAVQPVTPKPVGTLLGLDRDDKCFYITCDAAAGTVLRISPVGEVAVILAAAAGCGPPAIILDRRLLVLPRPDRVSAYSLELLRK